VQAVDPHGLQSPWSSQRCTAAALDDRALSASSGWKHGSGKKYFDRTITTGSRKGIKLTLKTAAIDRVAILASRAAKAGTIRVLVGGKSVGKVRLAGKAANQKWFTLPMFAPRRGPVVIKVLSKGKPVAIDGLGISQA
jgi:hypothetical protein